MPEDPNAPQNLGKLFSNIRKYVSDHKKGKIPNGHRKPVEALEPRKVCMVCVKPFDFITVKIKAERTVESAVCPECQKNLDDGCIACVYGDEYAFIKPKSEKMSDLVGKIIKVNMATMIEIKNQMSKNSEPDVSQN